MEAATSRTIRIGKANIGLIGLDIALNTATKEQLTEQEAIDFLFDAVSAKNYIPSGAEDKYRAALRQEYNRHLNNGDSETDAIVIRIFGTGCISCNNLQVQVIEVLSAMNLAADIEQIHDPDEIGRHGIIMTPALMINGKVKSGGRLPTQVQIEQWLKEVADHG